MARGRYRMRGSAPRRVRRRDPLTPIFKRLDKGVKKGIITQAEADDHKDRLATLQAGELMMRNIGR